MRAHLAAYLIVASALRLCIAAEGNVTAPDLQTHFGDRAVLSKEQIQTVLRLASEHGLDKPVSISTHCYLPILDDWNYYIIARGPETVTGRKISYVEVFIDHRELKLEEPMPNPFSKTNTISVHDFWVDKVLTNDLATFVVSVTNEATMTMTKQTIRVRVNSDVPLSTADRIVGALQTGKLRAVEGFGEDFNGFKDFKDLATGRHMERLSQIRRPAGTLGVFEICFGSLWLECCERQEEFVVTSIGSASH